MHGSLAARAKAGLESWMRALEEPEEAQARVLEHLTGIYAETELGRQHGIEPGMDLEAFRHAVPIRRYEDFRPYVLEVLKGNTRALLAEEPIWFGATSGTTGEPKLVPITRRDAELRVSVMLKGLARFVAYWHEPSVMGSACLAPCLPSRVISVRVNGREVPCGYISGINAELMAEHLGLGVLARYMAELNAIGPGVSQRDWERRFELALRALEGQEVRMAIGAGPALWMFARWLRRRRGLWPKDLWDVRLVLCAGVPHIQGSYVPELTKAFGSRAVVLEAYGATEGMFAIQADEQPFLVPFYDSYLLEARVGRRVKGLHEMRAGEVGRLVVSTPVFPRYEIGDVVACYSDGLYFRVLGRDKASTWARLYLGRLIRALASLF